VRLTSYLPKQRTT